MTTTRRGDGRVRFLTNRQEIEQKLLAGHSLRATYEELKDRLGTNYETFGKYARRFIGPVPANRRSTFAAPATTAVSAARLSSQAEATRREQAGQISPRSDSQPPTAIRPPPKAIDRPKLVFDKSPDPERIRRLLRRPEPDPAPE